MSIQNLRDFYIKGENDPLFDNTRIENVTWLDNVIAKLYMILLTNKGDVFGNLDFGADIPKYLWKTKFPEATIQAEIIQQINRYIPELNPNEYTVNVYILPGDFQDIGIINIDLKLTNVNVLFK